MRDPATTDPADGPRARAAASAPAIDRQSANPSRRRARPARTFVYDSGPRKPRKGNPAIMEQVDCVVIGAGVVGLAISRALAVAGREVIVLEAEDAIGTHTSSRNSEVIHAGLYYPKGSLKARFCVQGKQLLYEYCVAHGVPHRRSGKLIVATDPAQETELLSIQKKAHANG